MIYGTFSKVLILWFSFTAWCYGQPFVINLSETLAQTYPKEDIEAFFNHVYLPSGIQPKYVYYPTQRGLNLVNQGKLDAEGARFAEVGGKYSNLVRVDEPLGSIELILLCTTSSNCHVEKRKIGMIKGFYVGNSICEAMDLDCHVSDNLSTLAKLLDTGRIDSVLMTLVSSPSVVCTMESNQGYYHSLNQFEQPVFHFVHKSHKDLVLTLQAQIRTTRTSEIGKKIANTWKQKLIDCGKTLQKI